MKPGIQVAFIANGIIEFGIIAAIIRRESLTEEDSTQYVISSVCDDQTAKSDQLVKEDDLVSLDHWNPRDKLMELARRTEQFKWSYKRANPEPEPVQPAPPAPSTPEQIASAPLPASSLDNF